MVFGHICNRGPVFLRQHVCMWHIMYNVCNYPFNVGNWDEAFLSAAVTCCPPLLLVLAYQRQNLTFLKRKVVGVLTTVQYDTTLAWETDQVWRVSSTTGDEEKITGNWIKLNTEINHWASHSFSSFIFVSALTNSIFQFHFLFCNGFLFLFSFTIYFHFSYH